MEIFLFCPWNKSPTKSNPQSNSCELAEIFTSTFHEFPFVEVLRTKNDTGLWFSIQFHMHGHNMPPKIVVSSNFPHKNETWRVQTA